MIGEDQDQRSEPEAESQVQSTSDDFLHAVSIPAYETHRWKEYSCSPNLDEDLAQAQTEFNCSAALPVFSLQNRSMDLSVQLFQNSPYNQGKLRKTLIGSA